MFRPADSSAIRGTPITAYRITQDSDDLDDETGVPSSPPPLSPLLHRTAGSNSKVFSPQKSSENASLDFSLRSPGRDANAQSQQLRLDLSGRSQRSALRVSLQMSQSMSSMRPVRDLTEAEAIELENAFRTFDFNDSGSLDFRKLQTALSAMQFEVDEEELVQELAEYGKDKDSEILFDEFRDMAASRYLSRANEEDARQTFEMFDVDGTGKISFRNLRTVTREMEIDISDHELAAMISEFDLDGDGLLDLDEFLRMLFPEDVLDD